MFRCALTAVRRIQPFATPAARIISSGSSRSFSSLCESKVNLQHRPEPQPSLLKNQELLSIANTISPVQVRTVTKFSLKKGKRKTVKAAVRRFFRLHWGGWIRPMVGRKKRLWKKTAANRRRLRQHVFCNATQSTLLDKMVTKFWKKPKHYVEDPYAPYHTREEFYVTKKKPIVYPYKK